MSGFARTSYASGSWTDDDTAIAAITLLINAVEDGSPAPIYGLGI
jgi:hypothetical protein